MGRFVQDCDSHGSLKDIQILINNRKEIVNNSVYIRHVRVLVKVRTLQQPYRR